MAPRPALELLDGLVPLQPRASTSGPHASVLRYASAGAARSLEPLCAVVITKQLIDAVDALNTPPCSAAPSL